MAEGRARRGGDMPCITKTNLIEVAIRTLIRELVATYEARRRERRATKKCQPCGARAQEVQP